MGFFTGIMGSCLYPFGFPDIQLGINSYETWHTLHRAGAIVWTGVGVMQLITRGFNCIAVTNTAHHVAAFLYIFGMWQCVLSGLIMLICADSELQDRLFTMPYVVAIAVFAFIITTSFGFPPQGVRRVLPIRNHT